MTAVISIIITVLLTTVMCKLLQGADDSIKASSKDMKYILLCAAAAGAAIRMLHTSAPYGYEMLSAYLIIAGYEDFRTKSVHDFLHLLAALPGIWLCACARPGWPAIWELAVFLALQAILFRRLYGAADCFVFSVCALYLTAAGGGLWESLLHMLAAFILLAVVQAFRHNINRKGNLKEPAALVPYIAATVWLFL